MIFANTIIIKRQGVSIDSYLMTIAPESQFHVYLPCIMCNVLNSVLLNVKALIANRVDAFTQGKSFSVIVKTSPNNLLQL